MHKTENESNNEAEFKADPGRLITRPSEMPDGFAEIVDHVKRHTQEGLQTVSRDQWVSCIKLRMLARALSDPKTYLKLLMESSDELQTISDFVESPFSENEEQCLHRCILENILHSSHFGSTNNVEQRVWMIGNFSDEAVYSLAIYAHHYLQIMGMQEQIKFFVTDNAPLTRDLSRKGIFQVSSKEGLNYDRYSQYFTNLDDSHVELIQKVKDMVVFARHNITSDPPFSNITLLICRNQLELQSAEDRAKTMAHLCFSLKNGGYLLLGSDEFPEGFGTEFKAVDSAGGLFQRISNSNIAAKRSNVNSYAKGSGVGWIQNDPLKHSTWHGLENEQLLGLKDAILEDQISPTIVINDEDVVVHVAGEIDGYLNLPKKQLSLDVKYMINDQLFLPLKKVLSSLKQHSANSSATTLFYEGSNRYLIEIKAKVFKQLGDPNTYRILTIHPVNLTKVLKLSKSKAPKLHQTTNKVYLRHLQNELSNYRSYLRASVMELEASNQELKATNTELIYANELLQFNNHELESANKQLFMLNNEFEQNLAALTELNDDLNNFIQNTRIATLFLDSEYRIKRFTQALIPLINLENSDKGKDIDKYEHSFVDFDIKSTASHVQETKQTVEIGLTTENGLAYLMRCRPYYTDNTRINGVVFTWVDVTELKQKEDLLAFRAQELERKNKDLAQFAYVASHDLKAPITNMNSLIGLMDEAMDFSEESAEIFSKIKISVSRMNNTITTLNEVIALKNNLQLEKKRIKLSKALKDVVESLETQVKECQARIISDFSGCEWISFPPVHFQHILQNMISNAIKYRREGIAPIVKFSSKKLGGDKGKEKWIHLSISDNGQGIDLNAYGKKLFGLFQRFHLGTTGRGIGLYMTRTIVENYGGSIEVKSKVGKGTTFIVKFKV